MTISNKYNAGFCVLTIKVVGSAHANWNTKKLVENVFSINLWKLIVVKSGSIYANGPASCTHESGVEYCQGRRIELGAANKV